MCGALTSSRCDAGDKLIDHLKHWMNPEEVSNQTVQVAWQLGEQPAVAAAILELFHLLPAQSAKFMETEGAYSSEPRNPYLLSNRTRCGDFLLELTLLCKRVLSTAWQRGVQGSLLCVNNTLHVARMLVSAHDRTAGERPGLVVLVIELETALAKTPGVNVPCKLTSPYRAPLTKFLNKHAREAVAYFLDATRLHVRAGCPS